MKLKLTTKIPILSVYTITYNEETLLPFFIKHWRSRFKNCPITIFDNESTDNTINIAKSNNCVVIPYSTNNTLQNKKLSEIKNNCWKNAKSKFVAVQECDELTDIYLDDLINADWTLIKTKGYCMVQKNNEPIEQIVHGFYSQPYSKTTIFNKMEIKEINYNIGAHEASPEGNINYSNKIFNLYHYSPMTEDHVVKRWNSNRLRRSSQDKERGWGSHYEQSEQKLRDWFKYTQKISTKVKTIP